MSGGGGEGVVVGGGGREVMRLEAEDVVVSVGKGRGRIRLGVVIDVYESEDSADDSSEDEEDQDEKLKPGQLAVEWYPNGKSAKLNEEKVVLIDRSLMVGEAVCRPSDKTRVGCVVDFKAVADIVVLPEAFFVVRDVNIQSLNFLHAYDTSSSSCRILYGNWMGSVVDANQKMLLKSAEGYRGWLDNCFASELQDALWKPAEESGFDTQQWYVGQRVFSPFCGLKDVQWIDNFKPSDRITRRISSGSERNMNFIIEQVSLESITVKWAGIVPTSDCNLASINPPDTTIKAEDFHKIRKLDFNEHQTAQIGERMKGKTAKSPIITHDEWQKELPKRIEALSVQCNLQKQTPKDKKEKNDNDGGGSSLRVSQTKNKLEERKVVDSPDGSESQYYTASEQSLDTLDEDKDLQCQTSAAEETVESQGEEATEMAVAASVSTNQPGAKSSTPTDSVRRPVFSTRGRLKLSTARGGKPAKKKKAEKAPVAITTKKSVPEPPKAGEEMVGEVIFLRSFLDVMWRDGELERGIPAVDLSYFAADLDENVFCTGSYVQEVGSQSVVSGKFGFVHAVNDERVATVSWFSANGTDNRPVFLSKETVSELDMEPHRDFEFTPGCLVMRLVVEQSSDNQTGSGDSGNDLTSAASKNVGQMTGVDVDSAQLDIRWFDGSRTKEWPLNIIRVLRYDEDDDSYGEEDDAMTDDDDDSWSDCSSSWGTDQSGPDEERPEKKRRQEAVVSPWRRIWNVMRNFSGNFVELTAESETTDQDKIIKRFYHQLVDGTRTICVCFELEGIDTMNHPLFLVMHAAMACIEEYSRVVGKSVSVDVPKNIPQLMVQDVGMDESAESIPSLEEDEKPSARMEGGATGSQKLSEFEKPNERMDIRQLTALLHGLCEMQGVRAEDASAIKGYVERREFQESPTRELMLDVVLCCFLIWQHCQQVLLKDINGCKVVVETVVKEVMDDVLDQVEALQWQEDKHRTQSASHQDVVPKETLSKGSLEIISETPICHHFLKEKPPTIANRFFMKAVRHEMQILSSSLPNGIFVKGFEDRCDLFSCMMVGPSGTPFYNGLFFFDISLPPDYPSEPPLVFYRAFSSQQMNPNLYQDGKVCVSLLGTWSGKASELWNPGSNLLQVLVSIQGLILNSEPYFNEAGYESRRGIAEYEDKSRRYNEISLLRNLEALVRIIQSPPAPFSQQVNNHVSQCSGMSATVGEWMDGKGRCQFPLLPVSVGFKLSVKKHLDTLTQLTSSHKNVNS